MLTFQRHGKLHFFIKGTPPKSSKPSFLFCFFNEVSLNPAAASPLFPSMQLCQQSALRKKSRAAGRSKSRASNRLAPLWPDTRGLTIVLCVEPSSVLLWLFCLFVCLFLLFVCFLYHFNCECLSTTHVEFIQWIRHHPHNVYFLFFCVMLLFIY